MSLPLPLNLPLKGPNVAIRTLRPSDLAQFHHYREDPLLSLYQGWSPMNERQSLDFLHEMSLAESLVPGQWIQLGITLIEKDLLIGDIGLFLDTNFESAEIGFTLAREYHGQGLAAQAVSTALTAIFKSASVNKVIAITDARNAASIRLLERIGFAKVATRNAVFKGETCAEYVYEKMRSLA